MLRLITFGILQQSPYSSVGFVDQYRRRRWKRPTSTQSAQPSAPLVFNGGTGNDILLVNVWNLYTSPGNPEANTASLFVADNSAWCSPPPLRTDGINVDDLAGLSMGISSTATLGRFGGTVVTGWFWSPAARHSAPEPGSMRGTTT